MPESTSDFEKEISFMDEIGKTHKRLDELETEREKLLAFRDEYPKETRAALRFENRELHQLKKESRALSDQIKTFQIGEALRLHQVDEKARAEWNELENHYARLEANIKALSKESAALASKLKSLE